jgi:HK97 family phage major capsid protein
VNSSELEEMLNERDTRLGESVREYIASQTSQLEAQFAEKLQAGMAEWLKDTRGGDGAGSGDAARAVRAAEGDPARFAQRFRPGNARNALYSKRAPGAVLDGEEMAAGWGEFLSAVYHRAEQTSEVTAFKKRIQNAMSERVPSQGGFLVPEHLRSQVLMVALETAVVRPRARVIPMDSLRVPYPTIDDTSHTSSVYGGVIGYWTEEAAALTASQPSFGRAILEAKKLTGYTEIPNELLSDSVEALAQFFADLFPTALAFFEDVGFLTGTGVGQPQGALNSPCAVVTGGGSAGARAGGAGTAVQYGDITAMYARMWPASLNNAVWLCSPDVLPGLMGLVTASGIAPPLWLPNFSAADGYPGGGNGDGRHYELMGRPLIVSEKLPALAGQGCLAFIDFGYYLLGDRQEMQISSSEEYKFQNDLTAFRVIERVDGRTWIQSPITPENGGSSLSPVVLLHA